MDLFNLIDFLCKWRIYLLLRITNPIHKLIEEIIVTVNLYYTHTHKVKPVIFIKTLKVSFISWQIHQDVYYKQR